MNPRRSFFGGFAAGIAALFGCGTAAAATEKLEAEVKELEAELDAAWDEFHDQEFYVLDGWIVNVCEHKGRPGGWVAFCNALDAHGGGETKAAAITDLRECVACFVEFTLDEGEELPPKDIDTKQVRSVWHLLDRPVPAEYATEQLFAKLDNPEWVNRERKPHETSNRSKTTSDAA